LYVLSDDDIIGDDNDDGIIYEISSNGTTSSNIVLDSRKPISRPSYESRTFTRLRTIFRTSELAEVVLSQLNNVGEKTLVIVRYLKRIFTGFRALVYCYSSHMLLLIYY